ncbi:tetratricopeptide repeat protein [Kitasatospora sp. NPDC056800]|uniref:tetratricopeptide repeat protein n=1 Tax=Kitasatospora sp. NPDC056800 TaxID=3345948 RepID=UPI00369E0D45
MDVDDLDWQFGRLSGVLMRIVDEVLDRGGLEALVEATREREDWFCAVGAVRGLCACGEFERAWAVVEPFVATGWQPAVRPGADVLLRWGRTSQALELARPGAGERAAYDAWRDYAEVLVEAGLVDEAIDVLARRPRDGRTLWTLITVTEGRGRDERVLELLGPIAEAFRRDPEQPGVRDPGDALSAQARVLERSGRVDEAIGLRAADAAAKRGGSTVDDYAELLAGHGRIDELRELATGRERYVAARPYVTALENLGRAAEAEVYLRGLIAARHPGWYENPLMELLIRQGRFDDAVKAVEHTFDDLYDGNLLQATMVLLAEQGRHDQALELTEGRSPEFLAENDAFWLRSNRWWLMGEAGRAGEAIAEVEALPADEVDDREQTIAWLLARDGRIEEAIARLRPLPGTRAATYLAELLVQQGRFAEAIAAVPGVAAQREEERRFWTRRVEHEEPSWSDPGEECHDDPWTSPDTAPWQ